MTTHGRILGLFTVLAPLAAMLIAVEVGCAAPQEEEADEGTGAMTTGGAWISKIEPGEYRDAETKESINIWKAGSRLVASINWSDGDYDYAELDISITDLAKATNDSDMDAAAGHCGFSVEQLEKSTIRVKSDCGKGSFKATRIKKK